MLDIYDYNIDFFYKSFKEITINSILLSLMNIRINIINLKIIKNKVVFTHVYDIRFQDSFLHFFFVINEREHEVMNIIKKYFIIINNTYHNNRIFKFENLCVFNKKLRYKNLFIIYIY